MLLSLLAASPALAQERQEPDRSDPAVIEQERERQEEPRVSKPRVNPVPPPAVADAPRNGDVVVGAVSVTGNVRVPTAAFASAIEPFLGRPLGPEGLAELAGAVAGVARRSGYGLATAWVPAQDVEDGVLTVRVDEGRIDAVRATGPGAPYVEQRLAPIVGRGPVRTDELERQLMIAGDAAGIWVGGARLAREGGRSILVVATRYDRVRGQITVDNWGSSAVGPVRAWAEVDVNGIAKRGDGFTVGLSTTPLEPRTFQLVEAHYRLPLGGRGTTLAVGGYYGRTDVEPGVDGPGFRGDSWEIELGATHPLARSRAASLWASARFELRESRLSRNGLPVRDDRIASLTAGLSGYTRLAGGRLRMRASLVQGLDLFAATEPGDPLASREDAGGRFTKLESWAEYRRSLGGGFGAELAIRSQIADGPLLSSEEMGLGGPQFLRAFDYRERSGDEGVAAAVELQFDVKNVAPAVERLQFYLYADAGRVTNRGEGDRGGSLASAGGGLRAWLGKSLQAGAEVGIPLTDGADRRDPEPRLSFFLKASF